MDTIRHRISFEMQGTFPPFPAYKTMNADFLQETPNLLLFQENNTAKISAFLEIQTVEKQYVRALVAYF